MKNKYELDICQYLVSSGHAFFNYVDAKYLSLVDFKDTPEVNLLNKSGSIKSFQQISKNTGSEEEFDLSFNEESSSVQSCSFYEIENDDNGSIHNTLYKVENDNNCILNSYKIDNGRIHSAANEYEIKNEDCVHSIDIVEVSEGEEEYGFLKFSLETNEIFEGTLCSVMGPTSMTLMIMKIGGVDIKVSKDKMHEEMYKKCPELPALNEIIPGKF